MFRALLPGVRSALESTHTSLVVILTKVLAPAVPLEVDSDIPPTNQVVLSAVVMETEGLVPVFTEIPLTSGCPVWEAPV